MITQHCCANNCQKETNLFVVITASIVSKEKYETILCKFHMERLERGKVVKLDNKWSPSK